MLILTLPFFGRPTGRNMGKTNRVRLTAILKYSFELNQQDEDIIYCIHLICTYSSKLHTLKPTVGSETPFHHKHQKVEWLKHSIEMAISIAPNEKKTYWQSKPIVRVPQLMFHGE